MSYTLFDGIVIAVVLISALLAAMRGFVRETLSIASWIAAAVAAIYLYPVVLPYITPYVDIEILAITLAVAAIFLITLFIVSFITMRISDFILDSVAGPVDRILGFLFGAIRGLLIIIVAFTIFTFLVEEENQPDWVKQARTLPTLTQISDRIQASLPKNIVQNLIGFLDSNAPEPDTPQQTDTPGPQQQTPSDIIQESEIQETSDPDITTDVIEEPVNTPETGTSDTQN